jgi:subtilisin family serine protease
VNRILKVFADSKAQRALRKEVDLLEEYDAFALVETSAARAKRLAREYPVEDITDQYEIPLSRGTIDTTEPRIDEAGDTLAHPDYRTKKGLPGRHHYLVQFIGPIKDTWLRGIKRAGGEPRELHSNFAYVVRAEESALGKIASLPYVRWVGHLPYRARLAAPVLETVEEGKPAPTLPRTELMPDTFTVEFFGADDAAAARRAIRKLGFDIVHSEPKAGLLIVETSDSGKALGKTLEGLSAVHGVRNVTRRPVNRTSNEVAAGIVGTAVSMGRPGLGLSGNGETVAICDTGLDTGNPAAIHPDFDGRVSSIRSYPMTADFARFVNNPGGDDGPADLDSGHGTHVAGSVLGSGAASANTPGLTGPIRGFAYKAELVFQAVQQALDWKSQADLTRYGRYLLAGIPADLQDIFSDAYGDGARIHSNSWGGGDPGVYDEQCQALDQWVWDHKDFCVLVAAGNDGTDRDGDGRINPMSVSSPATAKNCITVGACENRRRNFDSETYGEWWPDDFPAAPFEADPMANDPQQVVPFSSRGPTRDGRFSPDVIAPGTFILSTRSRMIAQNNTAWAPFPPNRLYFHMGGTSMATPLVAGATAVVREYLRTKKGFAKPTAALLKATLIAGAVRLPGYGERGAVVDNEQGFGRLDLDAVLAPAQPLSSRFFEVAPGLRTGQASTRTIRVRSSTRPLRIALAYSDFPGASLVNDLNLIATGPDGRRVTGNQRSGGAVTLDSRNNAEVVQVARPAVGTWRIQVVGSNVPRGPQDFALVAVGAF